MKEGKRKRTDASQDDVLRSITESRTSKYCQGQRKRNDQFLILTVPGELPRRNSSHPFRCNLNHLSLSCSVALGQPGSDKERGHEEDQTIPKSVGMLYIYAMINAKVNAARVAS